LKLIIYGSIYELKNVIDKVFPRTLKQRCLNSKLSIILDQRYLKDPSHHADIRKDITSIFSRPTRPDVRTKLYDFIHKWQNEEPRISEFLMEDISYILNYFTTPRKDHSLTRSTQLIQPVFKEIREKTNIITCYRNIGVKKQDLV